MKTWLLLLALLSPLLARASDRSLELDVRYLNQRTQTDTFAQTLIYRDPVYSWLELTAAARFWQARSIIDGMSYLGQARLNVPGLPGPGILIRLTQVNRLSDSTTGTVLLGAVDLRGEFFRGFGGYLGFGYYKVFHSLSQSVPLPTFSGVSFSDADFATEFGFWLRPLNEWLVRTGIGTYEQVDVYNLNNPFLEARVESLVGEDDWVASLFGRYGMLLGFGRSSSLTFGLALRKNL